LREVTMPVWRVIAWFLACGLAAASVAHPVHDRTAPGIGVWEPMEAGLDFGIFRAPRPSEIGDSLIRVLRIDPQHFDLRLLNASATQEKRSLTPKRWCERSGCIAAINAGMYRQDLLTSVAFMRAAAHVNNGRLAGEGYKAMLVFDRLGKGLPPVKIVDRECDGFDAWMSRYETLVQGIRMVSCKRRNVWTQQPRQWSTAAIGISRDGRVLFIHVASPYTVHDLVDMLLDLPLDLSRAMYVEGGPEAQLYVKAGGREEELFGIFETGFLNSNDRPWPVPNVVGIARRKAPHGRAAFETGDQETGGS
jgi:hypothetical protein